MLIHSNIMYAFMSPREGCLIQTDPLPTGGAGYIGGQMVHELADAGERVVVLDNLSNGHCCRGGWRSPNS